ncbi:MAG: hypothetical protein HQ504_00360 [Rhodospirillaceae bacterium]|nr:hypothetical protein [Rhodospirillaceae bacterium]
MIYDKSAIHSFSEKEAHWLTNLYNVNMTPVLFMEIMADLNKYPNDLPLSVKQVRTLAKKFSPIDTHQNIHHREIWTHNLIGHHVPMDGRTMVGGGVELTASNGKKGIFIDEQPEEKALRRWKDGDFEEFEHELADRWRDSTRDVDLQQYVQTFKRSKSKQHRRIETLKELIIAVDKVCDGIGGQYRMLQRVLDDLEPNNNQLHAQVIKRWKASGRPPIRRFAPYAVYCHAVNLFFYVGVGEGMLSTRATNLIDLQYLYYLPFCKVFTSGDKFHIQIVHLFLQPDQIFVKSSALKSDLMLIVDMWEDSDKTGGIANFIKQPPRGGKFITEKIWDHCTPSWREWADAPKPKRSPEEDAKTMEHLRPMMEAIEAYEKRKKPDSH